MLDLLNLKRPTMEIRISEDETLNLYPASKRVIDKMVLAETTIKDVTDIYQLCAEIISCNKEGKKIELTDIEHLDIDALMIFIQQYSDFILGVKNDPN